MASETEPTGEGVVEGAAHGADTAAHGADTAAHGAEHGATGMPQLDFETWPSQIFWLVIALVVLYFLMSRIALPRIGSVIEERHDAIESDLDRAADYTRQAEEAEAAYELALQEARSKAQEIAAETRAEIQKKVDAAMAEAESRISERTAVSEARIAEIRDEAAASVEAVAADTAAALVEQMLPGSADDAEVRAAVAARLG